jgi:FOG: WD40 repeat
MFQEWAATIPFMVQRAHGQSAIADRSGTSFGDLPVRLIKELKHLELRDVSADGSRICAYATRNPMRSFVWNGAWTEKKNQVRDGEKALRIIDAASWNTTFAAKLPAMPYPPTGFFADGKAVYVEIPGVGGGGTLHLVINLQTGEQQEHLVPYKPDELSFSYRPLTDRLLLGKGNSKKTAHSEVLVKVELPSYREISRVAYAGVRSPSTGRTEAPMVVSPDRKTFLCSYDNTVVCRRSKDLGIVWTQKIDQERMIWRLALSPDASLAAASASNHVSVLDGKDGRELIRLPVDEAHEGLAISPDGKLLAIGLRVHLSGERSGTQPTVLLFDIASGKKLATLVHDQFRDGGREFLYANVDAFFLPDSKHLITSGLNTKVWEIGTMA